MKPMNDTVHVRRNDSLAAVGCGTVVVTSVVCGITYNVELNGVLYCPEMMYNLI